MTATNSESLTDKLNAATRPAPRPAPRKSTPAEEPQVKSAPQEEVKHVAVAETYNVEDVAVPTAPTTSNTPAEAVDTATAVEVSISDNSIITSPGALAVHEALKKAFNGGISGPATFKVAALQSLYTAEFSALAFEDISRILASSTDAYAARMKLLRTLHARMHNPSCGAMKLSDWLKSTAQADLNTLLYGLYGATYPGDNEFDVSCQHCGKENKLVVNVNDMPRVMNQELFAERLRVLLDPHTDHAALTETSLVGHTTKRRLPESGIVAEITNPSIQDHMDGVQWFVSAADRNTGLLPENIAGAEVIRSLTMHTKRLLVPNPANPNQFFAIDDQGGRASIIGRLSRKDGEALSAAIAEEAKRMEVEYSIPEYNCPHCNKRNSNQFVDFEALLFIKLQGKA